MTADLTGLVRKDAKGLYLGKVYGMGPGKFARTLGLPVQYSIIGHWDGRFPTREEAEASGLMGHIYEVAGPEAEKVLEQFDARAPFLGELVNACKRQVEKSGSIITILGRKCRFPKKPNGQYDWLHKALNRVTQGSAADQTKQAMVEADAQGLDLRLQVHDELGAFVVDAGEARRLADIMENTIKLEVPSRVDIDLGPSWGSAETIAR
jgi:DNA polymerase I-like protein with 3'-5' exonuclease and polymerase domains